MSFDYSARRVVRAVRRRRVHQRSLPTLTSPAAVDRNQKPTFVFLSVPACPAVAAPKKSAREEYLRAHHSTATPPSSALADSPVDRREDPEVQPSRLSGHTTPASIGYPSWLPRRPPPPEPASTVRSSYGLSADAEPEPEPPRAGGRKPTPRSVRVVRMQGPSDDSYGRRIPTDTTRVAHAAHARVWSRATTAGRNSALWGATPPPPVPRPRFRTSAFHPELLRSPALRSRLHFFLLPLFTFAHIPLQTYFDFNAVYILLQVARFPNQSAPGVSGTGRNWALGAAAYIACWAAWIFAVFIVYELVYSFARRWRVKRPLILPLYLSSSGFNLVRMTSYTNFCFFQHVRTTAFSPEQNGGVRDGLAETCWYYSQNLPTVALLLPRAGLALALLLSFWTPVPGDIALQDAGIQHRDGTFFRADGTLTDYSRGVLIANTAWTVWRAFVLLISWIGLWILSGQGCAGLCGPRYRWEEDEAEKTMSVYSDNGAADPDALPWSWRECTGERVQDAWEFCLTAKPPRWRAGAVALGADPEKPPVLLAGVGEERSASAFEGMEQVMAAIGLPSSPQPARRGVLSGDLFVTPPEPLAEPAPAVLADIIPPKATERAMEKRREGSPQADAQGPLLTLPYPFTGYGNDGKSGQAMVPFPPSPEPEGEDDDEEVEEAELEELDEAVYADESEEPSNKPRSSGSMSSLGQPVASRYPFQFRRPTRGSSLSSPVRSQQTPQSKSTPSGSGSAGSRLSQSTGNRESSESPMSHGRSSAAASPNVSRSSGSASASPGMPMPPRHPRHHRHRADTHPTQPASPSPSPVVSYGRPRARTRTESADSIASRTFGPVPLYEYEGSEVAEEDAGAMMEQPEAEGSQEAAESSDSVGLLSSAHSSAVGLALRSRASTLSNHRHGGSRSNSQGSVSVRSRAHSLIQSIGAASRSSVDLAAAIARSRNNSMARLSDAPSHSGSDALPSSPENYTFGHPLRAALQPDADVGAVPREEDEPRAEGAGMEAESSAAAPRLRAPSSRGDLESFWSSRPGSERVSPRVSVRYPESDAEGEPEPETIRVGRPIAPRPRLSPRATGLSTAPESFVTAPETPGEGTTDSTGRTPSTVGGGLAQHYAHGGRQWGPA